MKDNRRHKRYILDVLEARGKMILASDVEIIDVSLGGISIKVDRRVNMGGQYTLKFEDRGKVMSFKGTVMWASLSESRRLNGDLVPIYSAGMRFTGLSDADIKELLEFIGPVGSEVPALPSHI